MKEKYLKQTMFYMTILICTCALMSNAYGADSITQNKTNPAKTETRARQELTDLYEQHASTPSDINEHVPVLRKLAKECSSIVEIGLRRMVSTWGIILGLSENGASDRFYLGIDQQKPPLEKLYLIKRLAEDNEISFQFLAENEMQIDIPQTDMLFINSMHTYCHLTYELNKFASKVNKYIALHDTSPPWGYKDDLEYSGNYSEYPSEINRSKRGLWPAVEDFLASHPDWMLVERRFNNHGLTILKRQ
ncbi:MAG: hypothetical protein H0W50_11845 [Parachlamydiaceae bacterium]|nr:hypothetical protein [Parachlamydiaceae bacterium]